MHQEVFDKNQITELKAFIGDVTSEKIFVVRGNKSYHASGADVFVNELLGDSNYTSFFEFDPNPQMQDLEKGIALFKQKTYDLIIAIGGGSVLDMAKLISVFAHQKQDTEQYVKGAAKIEAKKTPLIAIPTTAGTGAEATHFGVLYIDKNKYSVAHPDILPNAIYLSSDFSKAASPYLTACTGLDAFCQAVESVWSVNANAESMEHAIKAIELIWNNLQAATTKNENDARQNMLHAAYLAGKAINITKTTAPHALSYAFTSYYNIPHGHAVALSLPYFLVFNYRVSNTDCTDKKGAEEVKKRIDKILNVLNLTIETAELKLVEYFDSLGVNINISRLIDNFDEQVISSNVNLERLSNNPRKVSENVIHEFLNQYKNA